MRYIALFLFAIFGICYAGNEFYVFNSEQTAINAAAHIDSIAGVPWVNYNQGEPDPTKTKTETWDIPWARETDGKWVMERLPIMYREQQPQEAIDYFNAAFPHTIETISDDWRPTNNLN